MHRLSVVALGTLLVACGGIPSVEVAHPAASGSLGSAKAVHLTSFEKQIGRAQQASDPEYLKDESQLVRLDGEGVCFDITVRQTRKDWVPIVPGKTTLDYGTGTLSDPQVVAKAPRKSPMRMMKIESWNDHLGNYQSRYVPTTGHFHEGGGVACFAHDGSIPASVSQLTLTLGGHPGDPPVFRFDLQSETPPSAWPAKPIVALGYEHLAAP